MKKPDNLEIKLLMKNIKKNNTIIERRNKTRQEMRRRRDEREKRFEDVFKRNELNEKSKKNTFYNRQMSRDMKDIQKRYHILKPQYDEDDLYYNNKDIKNKKIGNKINVFSNNRRNHINDIKNNFYKKNENLKINQDNNYFIENLMKVDNELKDIEKIKSNTMRKTKIKNNNSNNNTQTFNKTKTNINKNIYNINKDENKNNIYINNNNLKVVGKKYQFNDIEKKIDENKINNICLDGLFFENLKQNEKNTNNQIINNVKAHNMNNNKNKKK